jgi:hypothetical protein
VTNRAWFDEPTTRPSTSIEPFKQRALFVAVTAPSGSGGVAVRAGTVVTLGVERSATERTGRATGLDEARDGDGQAAGPLARQGQHSASSSPSTDSKVTSMVWSSSSIATAMSPATKSALVLGLEGEVLGQVVRSAQGR